MGNKDSGKSDESLRSRRREKASEERRTLNLPTERGDGLDAFVLADPGEPLSQTKEAMKS